MIKLKKVPILAVSFLLLLTNQRATANFPSIRPVPCTNYVTGESGICTFNWSCVNVAHGVHIGPCVDRFFVGTCCKIPEKTKQNNGKVQTTPKDGQIPPYTPLLHTLATKTETEKIKTEERRDNVTLNPIDLDDRLFSYTTKLSKPHIVFDYKPQSSQESNYNNSTNIHDKKPLISAEFLHKLFFSANASVNGNVFDVNQNSFVTSTYSPNPTTENPVFQTRSSTSGLRFQNKPVLDDSYNSRLPVGLDPTHNLRKPVSNHPNHDLRQPVKIDHQHDLRKPVPLSEEHDLRWPVLDEDSHDQRLPVINLYEWSGVWYLNNHQKPNGSDDFYSLTTQQFNPSVGHATAPPTESSQIFEQTTEKLVEETTLTPSISTTHENGDSFIHTSSNFTLFIRPTSSQPPETTVLPEEIKPESVHGSISQNLSQVCGRSRGGSTTARIVGGRKSHFLRWPWMISLRRYEDESYKHKCGATLLNEYWAITAAHCVEGKVPLDLMLRLGEYNFRRSDELHPHVERRVYVMVLHPEFDHITYENDLALLRFNEPVKLQANIVPVCLPDSMGDITGRIAVVTGWGRLSEAGELPASLHEVRMPILSNEECEQMYYEAGYAENIRDVFVCAGLSSGGLDACEGDSGGPMVVRGNEGQWTLVGLISWGMGCAAPKQPGVYTRISQFTDWIEGIILH
ncbi:hypothetical protein JTE90_026451 [Oedothorax gibbosus]|uniref:Peptidase S1 domain-containing protein n=1 Tax=Oedothorax gibbosus TaxID=931172 RepID=A0AAV6VPX4_9ARAC|nr:hypothetical protein JTE90_026451 [Oedothorax gibbosus]